MWRSGIASSIRRAARRSKPHTVWIAPAVMEQPAAPSGALGEHQLRGRLDVKLGGKNMTFYQTVTALPLGACMVDSE